MLRRTALALLPLLVTVAPARADRRDAPPPPGVRPDARGLVVFDVYRVKNRGRVACGLYRAGDPWLVRDPWRGVLAYPEDRHARCVFRGVPPGRYAISAVHDEDSDGEFDRGFFGIPTEGWVASNDAHLGRLGPPTYEDAEFAFDGTRLRLRARMRY